MQLNRELEKYRKSILSSQGKEYLRNISISLIISIILGLVVIFFTIRTHPLIYPKDASIFVEYWGFPFAWLSQTNHYLVSGPRNEIVWSGFTLNTLFWILVLFIPTTILSVFVMPSLRVHVKERCPICGVESVEKIPKEWVTSPGTGTFNPPTTFTSRYKYRCRKCQHEWED